MWRTSPRTSPFVLALVTLLFSRPGVAQEPFTILMTNDDGIEEVEARLLPVAERLRAFADVYIVVADQDRSGTSNLLSVTRRSSLESRLEYRSPAGEGLRALEVHSVVDGFPADGIVLGAFGILADRDIDLVISGPNGGANLADGWFGSGTIGAARTAAFLGLPSLAISGLDSDAADQVAALADWIARLARSEVALQMAEGAYLTVGIPRVPPQDIRGIRVAPRARTLTTFDVSRVATLSPDDDDEPVSIWAIAPIISVAEVASTEDVALYSENWIVVTPMTVGEQAVGPFDDPDQLERRFPQWRR